MKLEQYIDNTIIKILHREGIELPIEIGDVVLGGRFKNHKIVVRSIETDDKGQPTINGKSILKFRIPKLMPNTEDIKEAYLTENLEDDVYEAFYDVGINNTEDFSPLWKKLIKKYPVDKIKKMLYGLLKSTEPPGGDDPKKIKIKADKLFAKYQ